MVATRPFVFVPKAINNNGSSYSRQLFEQWNMGSAHQVTV